MKLARCLLYAVTILGDSVIFHAFSRHVLARDFAQYANVPQEIRDWYANAELTDAARYYCYPAHAEFGLEKGLAAVELIGRKVS